MTTDFRRIALAAAIAIVSTILVAMSARAIFPGPERPGCQEKLFRAPDDPSRITGEEQQTCERQVDEFEAKDKQTAKNQFFVLLAGSVGLVVVGGFVYTIPVVSSGILWGGVVSLIFSLSRSPTWSAVHTRHLRSDGPILKSL